MKISTRLRAICEFVEPGSDVIDVGCDHGLAGIFLALEKHCTVVCTDINENALNNAKKNIVNYGVEEKVKAVITDGLQEMDISNKTILICGMGTRTIMHIINHVIEYNMKELIIQSNNDLDELRKYMFEEGFYIADEKYVVENDKHYVIMKFKIGNMPYTIDDIIIGPVLKTDKYYLQYLYDNHASLLKQIPHKYHKERKKLKQEKNIIRDYLKNVD